MKIPVAACAAALAFLALVGAVPAEGKGCLKGALVGGVAGHYAGHHGALGAIGGCVVGRHLANENDKGRAARPSQTAAPPSAGY